jgi:hypothetical protein
MVRVASARPAPTGVRWLASVMQPASSLPSAAALVNASSARTETESRARGNSQLPTALNSESLIVEQRAATQRRTSERSVFAALQSRKGRSQSAGTMCPLLGPGGHVDGRTRPWGRRLERLGVVVNASLCRRGGEASRTRAADCFARPSNLRRADDSVPTMFADVCSARRFSRVGDELQPLAETQCFGIRFGREHRSANQRCRRKVSSVSPDYTLGRRSRGSNRGDCCACALAVQVLRPLGAATLVAAPKTLIAWAFARYYDYRPSITQRRVLLRHRILRGWR